MKLNYTTTKQQLFQLRYNLLLVKEDEERIKIQKQIDELKHLMIREMRE